jgi:hypothetical protein
MIVRNLSLAENIFMIEALVGVLFAACFVTIYFIISLLRQRGDKEGTRWSELYPPALKGATPVEAKQKLFKPAEELSRHHLSQGGATARKMVKAGTDQPGQGQRQGADQV